jgi:hypothetical protein
MLVPGFTVASSGVQPNKCGKERRRNRSSAVRERMLDLD